MIKRASYLLLILVFCILTIPHKTNALSQCDLDAIYRNSVHYVEDGCESSSCSASPTTSTAPGGNLDYRGRPILTTGQLAAIKANQPFYQAASQKTGVPWQMLAVIHLRETGLSRVNPGNGQGVYQNVSGGYPAGPTSDQDFQAQTDTAAQTVLSKAGDKAAQLKAGNADTIKWVFFGYNGRAQAYIDQAKRLGFTDAQAQNGEGSPYVMNKADAKRDPDAAVAGTWGQIKTDGGSIEYPANSDYGAFVEYAALAGISLGSCGDSGPITEGGLTKDQAIKFMQNYGANKDNFSAKQTGALWPMCGGHGSNCVTFSYFFNHTFTNLPAGMGDGNGEAIVSSLAKKGAKTGSVPKVFATFSWSNGGFGHTGIVLGIHGDQVIVGNASCSAGASGAGDGVTYGSGAGVIQVGKASDPATWLGHVPTEFAYPDNVNTQNIQKFIDSGEL